MQTNHVPDPAPLVGITKLAACSGDAALVQVSARQVVALRPLGRQSRIRHLQQLTQKGHPGDTGGCPAWRANATISSSPGDLLHRL